MRAIAATGEIGTSHKPGHYHTSPPRRQRVAPQPIHRAEKLKTSAPERDYRQKRGMPEGEGGGEDMGSVVVFYSTVGLRSCWNYGFCLAHFAHGNLAASAGSPCFLQSYTVSTYRNR